MDWQHEVWAEALWVEQSKGEDGPRFIAEQIAWLALNGDEAGIARWKRIAAAFDDLRAGRVQ
jgi:hypothetical protein